MDMRATHRTGHRVVSDLDLLQRDHGVLVRRMKAAIPGGMEGDLLACETNQGRFLLLHARTREQIYGPLQSVLADCQRQYPRVQIATVYVTPELIEAATRRLENETEGTAERPVDGNETEALALFKSLITIAAEHGASDVHMEIYPTGCKVRMRVNGFVIEHPLRTPDQTRLEMVIRCAYNTRADAGSRSAQGDLPDNSVASAAIDIDLLINGARRDYKLRMESSPDLGGRTAVFRLNDMGRFRSLAMMRGNTAAMTRTLMGYGYAEDQVACIVDAVRAKRGLFVVGGPVGSGKTTLLYTILVYTSEDGVISRAIEDPIEAELPGVRQVATSVGVNMDSLSQTERDHQYAKFLRSALRMDVDQLLVGEIRSREMAQVALDLYQSGHAGFSTMHFGQVFDVVDRLTSDTMGLERDVVAQEGFFRLVMVQELLPVLCDCKLTAKQAHISDAYLDSMQHVVDLHDPGLDLGSVRFRNREGCPQCQNRTPGIQGREAVAEVLEDSAAMMDALRNRRTAVAKRLFSMDRKPLNNPASMGRSLFENALHKVLAGRIDPRDVEMVLQPFSKAIRDRELAAAIRKEDTERG